MPTTVPTQFQASMPQQPLQPQQQYPVGAGNANSGSGVHAPGPPPVQQTQAPAAPLQMHQAHATQQAHLQQQGQQQQQQQQQQFQRLKVEDALSYLDQVKLQFGNQPQVYNEFLDIMKEFKSQTIDTPGVINRVSNLFKGHSDLIVGFNTFLPPGYKIEVQANEISVHQPGQAVMSLSTVMGLAAAAQTAAQTAAPAEPAAPKPTQSSAPLSSASNQTNTPASSGAAGMAPAYTNRRDNRPNWDNFLKALPQPTISGTATGGNLSYQQSMGRPGPPHDANVVATAAVAISSPPQHHQQPAANQPVEFNHAINYVNKIKNRFQGQPEVYKSFLEILHTYQKEQRNIKEGLCQRENKPLTEREVYNQVASLFQKQDDLLDEFGQFLPDANNGSAFFGAPGVLDTSHLSAVDSAALGGVRNDHSSTLKKTSMQHKTMSAPSAAVRGSHIRRVSTSGGLPQSQAPLKKPRKDLSVSEIARIGTLAEYAFFDKVRKAVKNQEAYENFLRCLYLFNEELVSRTELVSMVKPFIGKFTELFRWFKDFLGYKESGSVEPVPANTIPKERIGELAKEIDFTTCKRYGASYRELPRGYDLPKCSGRTPLCKEVLNDVWVSFPSWSEDSNFVTSRKNQYEELIYRTEDERFQMDIVLETNAAAMKSLEITQRRMVKMPPEDAAKFKLDNNLGGTSETLNRKAVARIYGDKAPDIIDGLRKNPVVAVPLVLRRLKAKEEEWRDAQRKFNKIWREQNEKYYLKSLDHQGMNFKQNDVKQLRTKALLNEIETIFDERQEAAQAVEDGSSTKEVAAGPHLTLYHRGDRSILEDAASLLVHHVKRQSSLHTKDKHKIKQLLYHFLPDLFYTPQGVLSDDEDEEDDEEAGKQESTEKSKETSKTDSADENKETKMETDEKEKASDSTTPMPNKKTKSSPEKPAAAAQNEVSIKSEDEIKKEPMETDNTADNPLVNGDDAAADQEDNYSLFFVSNHWYLFLRLHQLLCERLYQMSQLAQQIAEEDSKCKRERKESTAMALRLKAPSDVEPEQYYPYFLDRIKDLLDGNMESATYEDTLREMFGIHAYTAFTMDKIVQYLVRQLNYLVTEDNSVQPMELFLEQKEKGGTGGPISSAHQRNVAEQLYQRKAEAMLAEENCFKVVLFAKEAKLTLELLDTEEQDNSDGVEASEQWTSYIEKFVLPGSEDMPAEIKASLAQKPVFMARNARCNLTEEDGEKAEESAEGHNTPAKSSSPTDAATTGDPPTNDSSSSSKPDMDILNNIECKFNVNSFKMVYVIKSESYLYKRNALTKARQSHRHVSLKKHEKFVGWLDRWVKDNVKDNDDDECTNWLMGEIPGLKDCTTRCYRNNPLARSPYYTYNRFRVTYPEPEKQDEEESPLTPDSTSMDCS